MTVSSSSLSAATFATASSPSSPSASFHRKLHRRASLPFIHSSSSFRPRRRLFSSPATKNGAPSSIRCSSGLADMDAVASTGLYPLHHCKTIHLVRHAQGVHNVAGEKDYKAYMSDEYFDAQLTPLGWNQVDNLRTHVNSCGLTRKIDLVITSPLLRTMQTAVGVFGGESYKDGINVSPLMIENVGNSGRPAISSLNCPQFVAVELCREHLGVHPCDKRRSIKEYRDMFPAIDFSLIENDEDILWTADTRETNGEVAARGNKFINWLFTRKEKEIAIVSHSGFLFHTLKTFGHDCHPTVKEELSKHFANCELRSMVLVDRSVQGHDIKQTDFPGKVPQGLDLPRDIAHEKHPDGKAI